VVTSLGHFQGPLPPCSFLTLEQWFLFSNSILWQDSLPYIVPSWARQLSSRLFLASTLFPPPICLPCLLSFCFSPLLSFSVYQLLLLLFPLSFISCYIISVPPLPFLYHTPSLFTSFHYPHTTPPISISLLPNCSLFSTPSSLSFSPVLQST
jgi:hypothetical protein